MLNKNHLLLIILALTSPLSTHTQENFKNTDVTKYYYNEAFNSTRKIYQYSCSDSSHFDLFWDIRMIHKHDSTLLETEAYTLKNGNPEKVEYILEYFSTSGSQNVKYSTFSSDTINKIINEHHFTVLNDTVYRWKMSSQDTLSWKFEYVQNGLKTVIQKRRSLKNKDTSIRVLNQVFDAITFFDQYDITTYNLQGDIEEQQSFQQESIYAESIGMVKYTRVFKSFTLTFQLVNIYSEEEFNLFLEKR